MTPYVHTEAGIERLPAASMAVLLGELNTEARCIALVATPTELTAMRDINEDLRQKGAFDIVDRSRFNVHGHLSAMPDYLATTVSDPLPEQARAAWAIRSDCPTGVFATAMAGALLRFSDERNVSLRTLIGEKRSAAEGKMHSIETRLGVLATVASLTLEGKPVTSSGVAERAQDFGLGAQTIWSHLHKLARHGFLNKSESGSTFTITETKNGHDTGDTLDQFLRLVSSFAIGASVAIEKGADDARAMLYDSSRLPLLVEKSYKSSTHTGKSTSHRN